MQVYSPDIPREFSGLYNLHPDIGTHSFTEGRVKGRVPVVYRVIWNQVYFLGDHNTRVQCASTDYWLSVIYHSNIQYTHLLDWLGSTLAVLGFASSSTRPGTSPFSAEGGIVVSISWVPHITPRLQQNTHTHHTKQMLKCHNVLMWYCTLKVFYIVILFATRRC